MTDKQIIYTIPLPPVTKKNHGQIIYLGAKCAKCHRGMKAIMLPSKPYKEYEKSIKPYANELLTICGMIDYPINLECKFYQKERRLSDLAGHLQAIQDLLVHYKVLADDNRNIVASTDGSEVLYDKAYPRTEIIITPKTDYDIWVSASKSKKKKE